MGDLLCEPGQNAETGERGGESFSRFGLRAVCTGAECEKEISRSVATNWGVALYRLARKQPAEQKPKRNFAEALEKIRKKCASTLTIAALKRATIRELGALRASFECKAMRDRK